MTHSAVQSLEYIGFEPSDSLTGFASEKLYRVVGESPSDSITRGFIRKTKNGFEGCLQVRSIVGTFVANVIGEDPLKVIDDLSQKVRHELLKWKKNRDLDQVI